MAASRQVRARRRAPGQISLRGEAKEEEDPNRRTRTPKKEKTGVTFLKPEGSLFPFSFQTISSLPRTPARTYAILLRRTSRLLRSLRLYVLCKIASFF